MLTVSTSARTTQVRTLDIRLHTKYTNVMTKQPKPADPLALMRVPKEPVAPTPESIDAKAEKTKRRLVSVNGPSTDGTLSALQNKAQQFAKANGVDVSAVKVYCGSLRLMRPETDAARRARVATSMDYNYRTRMHKWRYRAEAAEQHNRQVEAVLAARDRRANFAAQDDDDLIREVQKRGYFVSKPLRLKEAHD